MPTDVLNLSGDAAPRIELKSYILMLPMGTLAIGVDNIHHDIYLSPKFVQATRDYLFELIRQHTASSFISGMELRNAKTIDGAGFRKLLSELLQSAVTQAKFYKNIEIDVLFRLAVLKFITQELSNQFANIILEGKEWIRQRGEHFERSQQAHVLKAKLSELQSARRGVLRVVGQQVAQMIVDAEENVVCKTRRALFGEDFAPYYELLKNRLIFLDGGKDDSYFLEHFVLLGNYVRDPDRFEAMDALFQEFLQQVGVAIPHDPDFDEAQQAHQGILDQAQGMRDEIANLEEQRETLRRKLDRGDSFLNKFIASSDPANVKASLNDVELRLKHQELKLEEFGPQIEVARQKLDFFLKDRNGRLGDFLNEPDNARRLFDPAAEPDSLRPRRTQLLSNLLDRLEQHEVLYHVLASYEIRAIAAQYHPPLHLQQLRKALVSKDELKRVEQVLKQVHAKQLSAKPIEELSRKIHRYSRDEMQ